MDTQTKPTAAEFQQLDVHESRNMLRGRDDTCNCKPCKRVKSWLSANRGEWWK